MLATEWKIWSSRRGMGRQGCGEQWERARVSSSVVREDFSGPQFQGRQESGGAMTLANKASAGY